MKQRGKKSAAALAVVPAVAPPLPAGAPVPPPDHLSVESAEWWRSVIADYDLEGHHVRLLQCACESWDRMQAARQAVADHGALTFADVNGNLKAHPAVAIERDARVAFARLVRELDLDAGAPAEAKRPPGLVSNRAG